MEIHYCCFIIYLLCGRIPAVSKQIEAQGSRASRLDRDLCLGMCPGAGQTGVLSVDFPAECEEFCRSQIHREDILPKVQKRTRKSIEIGRKKCFRHGLYIDEPLISKSNISVEFKKETNGSWVVMVQWNPRNDVSRWEGYRLTYKGIGSSGKTAKSNCIFLQKNQTHVTLHTDKDNWHYPQSLGVIVSMYNYNSSLKDVIMMSVYSPPGPTSIAAPFINKESYLAMILGILCGLLFVAVLIWIYSRTRRRKRRYINPLAGPQSNTEDNAATKKEELYGVSYYPESEEYTDRIASIVNWFRESAGYDVIMDKMASNEISSKGPMAWAESQIKKASKVLVFLSQGYVRLCADDEQALQRQSADDIRRVWYEMRLLKTVFCNTQSAAKMVCILMDETINVHNLPPWAEVRYRWPIDRDEILKRLNNKTEISPARIAGNTMNVE